MLLLPVLPLLFEFLLMRRSYRCCCCCCSCSCWRWSRWTVRQVVLVLDEVVRAVAATVAVWIELQQQLLMLQRPVLVLPLLSLC